MLIRKMTFADIEQAAEIEKQCFSDPWSEKSFEDSLAREDTLFLVCEEENSETEHKELGDEIAPAGDKSTLLKEKSVKIVGCIGLYISFDEGYITNVAIAPGHRRKGYGEAMLAMIKKQAKENAVEKIFLEVRVSNIPAILLYEKLGFEKLGVRKNFYDYPKEDAYIMSCDLL